MSDKVFFCWEASYMNYKKVSNKARCSMSPRNSPHEVNQVVALKGGIRKTIYYCTFRPEQLEFPEPHEQQSHVAEPKISCRLDGT